MKKRIRNSICIICALILTMANTAFASNNTEYVSIDEKKDYLLEKGYDEQILNEIEDENVEVIYRRMTEDFCGEAIVSATKEVSVETFEETNSNGARADIVDSKLQLTGVLNNYATSSGTVLGSDLIVSYKWLVSPGERGDDAIIVNWNPNLLTYSDSSFSAHSGVYNASTGSYEYHDYKSEFDVGSSGALGWYTELCSPYSSQKVQFNPEGNAMMFFEPAYTFSTFDNLTCNFVIEYAHNKSSFSVGFSYGGVSISFNPSSSIDTMVETITYRSSEVNSEF